MDITIDAFDYISPERISEIELDNLNSFKSAKTESGKIYILINANIS